MNWAEWGEQMGKKYIKPGSAIAVAVAVGLGIASGTDFEKPAPEQCEKHPRRNVYHPWRLHVLDTCVTETVTVVEATPERDGDWHVGVIPEHAELVNDINRARQHGLLVVEFVPLDPRPRVFRTGMKLKITGTLVEDLQHGPAAPGCHREDWPCGGRKRGWRELHPVFDVEEIIEPGLAPAPKAPPIEGEHE